MDSSRGNLAIFLIAVIALVGAGIVIEQSRDTSPPPAQTNPAAAAEAAATHPAAATRTGAAATHPATVEVQMLDRPVQVADGVVTADQKATLLIRALTGRDFVMSGEFFSTSADGVQFFLRQVDSFRRYEFDGAGFRVKRTLLAGQMRPGIETVGTFDPAPNSWRRFTISSTAKRIVVSVDDVEWTVVGPLEMDGTNQIELTPGAKLRGLTIAIAGEPAAQPVFVPPASATADTPTTAPALARAAAPATAPAGHATTTAPANGRDIKLVSAVLIEGNRKRDVLDAVRAAYARDPFAPIQPTAEQFGLDSSSTALFSLSYTVDGVLVESPQIKMNQIVIIPAAGKEGVAWPGASQTFTVIAARYGRGTTWVDLTPKMQEMFTSVSGKTGLNGTMLGPDPVRYHPKVLLIWWEENGRRFARTMPIKGNISLAD